MEELVKPSWWISVVIAGLLVNLVSAYLKPRLDAVLLRSSSWWRTRSAARIAEQEAYTERLLADDREMALAYSRMFEALLNSIWFNVAIIPAFLLGAALLPVLPKAAVVGVGVFGVMCGGYSLSAIKKCAQERAAIRWAEMIRKRTTSSSDPPV